MSVLHRVDVADGSLLEIVSGLECAARRFDALVDRYAPSDAERTGDDDPRTVDLLLGLVAVRERLRDVLARASVERPTTSGAGVDRGVEGSWLR